MLKNQMPLHAVSRQKLLGDFVSVDGPIDLCKRVGKWDQMGSDECLVCKMVQELLVL